MREEQIKKRALLARALVRTTLARCELYYSGAGVIFFLLPFSFFHLYNTVLIVYQSPSYDIAIYASHIYFQSQLRV